MLGVQVLFTGLIFLVIGCACTDEDKPFLSRWIGVPLIISFIGGVLAIVVGLLLIIWL